MAPRSVLRTPDDTVRAALQHFVAKEREYAGFLEGVEARLAKPLRFCVSANGADAATRELLDSPDVAMFFAHARQLSFLHRAFADKLHVTIDTGDLEEISSVMADWLVVTRVVYAQLQAAQAGVVTAFNAQLKLKTATATHIVRSFLQEEKISMQQLIEYPLHHLRVALESVDIIIGSAALTAECEATKMFVRAAQIDADQERALIKLQQRLYGEHPVDLCGKTLTFEGEVHVVHQSSTEIAAIAEHLTAHCFDDGTLLLSGEVGDALESESSMRVKHEFQLKQDATFIELAPLMVSRDHPTSAVLISRDASFTLTAVNHVKQDALVATVSAMLGANEARTLALRNGRSSEDLDLPHDLEQLKQSAHEPQMVFPSFHDDDLPGVFWMKEDDAENHGAWRLVELVCFDRWLLVFSMNGWKKHTLLHQVDMTAPSTDVAEQQRDGDEWGLVVSTQDHGDEAARLVVQVVSRRRTRIDFWFDQISKAIAAALAARKKQKAAEERAARHATEAARRASEAAAAAAAKTDTGEPPFISVRGKKRQRNTVPVEEDAAASGATSGDEPSAAATNAPVGKASTAKKRKGKASVGHAEEGAEKALEDNDSEISQPGTTASDAAVSRRLRTPPVKTPKQRWVTRKTEDPEDTTLQETQPSGQENDVVGEPQREHEPEAERAESTAPQIRVILTGLEPSPKTFKKIGAIPSAEYEEDIEKATHVIAPKNQLKRTVKLLCGISCCDHVVDERWLDESARTGIAVYERQFCLKDAKAEAKWHFDLRKTMYDFTKEQRRALFRGHRVFITPHPSILPPVGELVKIVQCAGGEAATSGSPGPSDLVITSEVALRSAAVQKLVAHATPQRLYTSELVLSSILQQHIDFEQHRVTGTGAATGGATPTHAGSRRSAGAGTRRR